LDSGESDTLPKVRRKEKSNQIVTPEQQEENSRISPRLPLLKNKMEFEGIWGHYFAIGSE
jgi:hypothetical protein